MAGAAAGEESCGKYMADGAVSYASWFVLSEEGRMVGEKVWDEVLGKLEKISPGIGANIWTDDVDMLVVCSGRLAMTASYR